MPESSPLYSVQLLCVAVEMPTIHFAVRHGAIGSLASAIPRGWLRNLDNLRQSPKTRPNHTIMLLIAIENVSQMNAPDNITISADSRHQMPPAVTLQEETPRHANGSAPPSQRRTVLVVYTPDGKPSQKDGHAEANKQPHRLEDLHVSLILVFLLLF